MATLVPGQSASRGLTSRKHVVTTGDDLRERAMHALSATAHEKLRNYVHAPPARAEISAGINARL